MRLLTASTIHPNCSPTSVTHSHLLTKHLPLNVLPRPPSHHVHHQTCCHFFPAHRHISFPLCAITFWHVSIFGWKCQRRRTDSFARNQDSTANTASVYIHWTGTLFPELLQHSPCGIFTSRFSVHIASWEKDSLSTNFISTGIRDTLHITS